MMNKLSSLKYSFLMLFFAFSIKIQAQELANWTRKQLIQPSELADIITTKTDIPVILSVGPGAIIPNSIDLGPTSAKEGQDKLKAQLNTLAKDQKIVIYCGCCPFERCPNVRPAIDILKQMNFTNYFLLNLPHNIKIDWIDEGYPMSK